MTPDEAFEAFANGTFDCFDTAAPKIMKEIRAYLWLLGVKNDEELEDLAEKAIFRVVQKVGKLCGMGAEGVCRYVFVICKNLVRDRAREGKRRAAHAVVSGSKPANESVLLEALEYCISRLSDKVQAMFRAHFFGGLPTKRIAQMKGIAERTCQDQLQKAKRRVADCLRRQGYR